MSFDDFFSFGGVHQSVAALQSPPTLTLLIFRRPKKKRTSHRRLCCSWLADAFPVKEDQLSIQHLCVTPIELNTRALSILRSNVLAQPISRFIQRKSSVADGIVPSVRFCFEFVPRRRPSADIFREFTPSVYKTAI